MEKLVSFFSQMEPPDNHSFAFKFLVTSRPYDSLEPYIDSSRHTKKKQDSRSKYQQLRLTSFDRLTKLNYHGYLCQSPRVACLPKRLLIGLLQSLKLWKLEEIAEVGEDI